MQDCGIIFVMLLQIFDKYYNKNTIKVESHDLDDFFFS
jgi:hypothetical protein